VHSETFKRWKETPGGMLWIKGIRTFPIISSIGLDAHRCYGLQLAMERVCFGKVALKLIHTNGLFDEWCVAQQLSSVSKTTTRSARSPSCIITSVSEIRPPNPAKTSSAPSCTNFSTTSPASPQKLGSCTAVMLPVDLQQRK
jgi:hypothetical protein